MRLSGKPSGSMPTTRLTVRDVVALGSGEQMVGPNARRVVARVTDDDTGRELAVDEKPGIAMGLERGAADRHSKDPPVALPVAGALPLPTALASDDAGPETVVDD
jgi:hypothetical protein